MSWSIRQESPQDAASIDALVEACFGPGRYAKSAYRLRDGVEPVADLGFVAVEDGALRGSVRFWPVMVGQDIALLLGPLAVQSAQRGRGMGIALMERGIEEARNAGYSCIILVGDEPYYARVGFARLAAKRIQFPGPVDPSRVLALSLKPGTALTLSGQVVRPHIDNPVCADGAPLGAG